MDRSLNIMENSKEVFQKASEFLTKKYGITNSPRVSLFLVAIIDTKRKFKHPDSLYTTIRDVNLKVLKQFSLNKIQSLLQYPEF